MPKLGLRPFCILLIKFVFAVEPELKNICFQSTVVVVVVTGENVKYEGVG